MSAVWGYLAGRIKAFDAERVTEINELGLEPHSPEWNPVIHDAMSPNPSAVTA
jgi:hypothetical protein